MQLLFTTAASRDLKRYKIDRDEVRAVLENPLDKQARQDADGDTYEFHVGQLSDDRGLEVTRRLVNDPNVYIVQRLSPFLPEDLPSY